MNYKRLGRKHARRTLKEFFTNQDQYVDECNDLDCLIAKATELFFDLQLRDAMDPESKFQPPPDEASETEYNEAALDLITKTIRRSPPNQKGAITNPEKAYDTGCEIMGEILSEVLSDILPEDYEGDIKKTIQEKCWALLEEKAGEDIPLPKVHAMVLDYYDRGIHDTLQAVDPPPKPVEPTLFDFPRRVARYEKLLMGL